MWLPIIFRADFINVNDGLRETAFVSLTITKRVDIQFNTEHDLCTSLFLSSFQSRCLFSHTLSCLSALQNHSPKIHLISFSPSESVQMLTRPQQPKRIRVNRLSRTAMTALFTDRPRGGRSVRRLHLFTLHTTERKPWTERCAGMQHKRCISDCCYLEHSTAQVNSCLDCGEICVLFLFDFIM